MAMFDHLIKVNDLQSSFDQYDITATDLKFVKEQIAGPNHAEQCSSQTPDKVSLVRFIFTCCRQENICG